MQAELQAQLSQMATLIDQQKNAASDLGTLLGQVQATEKIAEGRYEQTLQSLWTESNQIVVDDITAQIRFIAHSRQSSAPPNAMFENNWDLLLSIRSPQNAGVYTQFEQSPLGYYSSSHMFRSPVDLMLIASSQTSRPIHMEGSIGQFSTYRLLRHHYIAGDLDRWRLGHQMERCGH